jgi:hypothetical protein
MTDPARAHAGLAQRPTRGAAPIKIKAHATGAAKRRSGRYIQPKPHGDAAASVQ